jgi:hypothetical protein
LADEPKRDRNSSTKTGCAEARHHVVPASALVRRGSEPVALGHDRLYESLGVCGTSILLDVLLDSFEIAQGAPRIHNRIRHQADFF